MTDIKRWLFCLVDRFLSNVGRKRWFCKSDINVSFIHNVLQVSGFTVKEVKREFDLFNDTRFIEFFLTGDYRNKKHQRHTRFINAFAFRKFLVK